MGCDDADNYEDVDPGGSIHAPAGVATWGDKR